MPEHAQKNKRYFFTLNYTLISIKKPCFSLGGNLYFLRKKFITLTTEICSLTEDGIAELPFVFIPRHT